MQTVNGDLRPLFRTTLLSAPPPAVQHLPLVMQCHVPSGLCCRTAPRRFRCGCRSTRLSRSVDWAPKAWAIFLQPDSGQHCSGHIHTHVQAPSALHACPPGVTLQTVETTDLILVAPATVTTEDVQPSTTIPILSVAAQYQYHNTMLIWHFDKHVCHALQLQYNIVWGCAPTARVDGNGKRRPSFLFLREERPFPCGNGTSFPVPPGQADSCLQAPIVWAALT
eukprot:357845-Chlamydomonas_euryale.AAC.4